MYQLQGFDPHTFLANYWQKQPLLIRGGFVDFIDPLDEHDLAGLAQEPDVDSRIVSNQGQKWQASQGPFEDFEPYCQGKWSLLVQSVDRYLDEASDLLNAFNFIPRWRLDDLMVSYSVPGGGVGPHVDQYDVFIIQGKGSRRWQVGAAKPLTELQPHPLLRQVEPFTPILDEVLQSGDILYIPPGFPHAGEALSDCLNYSVGFRAPNQQELLSSFADYVLDQQETSQRHQDPGLSLREFQHEITRQDKEALRALMLKAFDGEGFDQWLGSFLSEAGPAPSDNNHEFQMVTTEQISAHLQAGLPVVRRLDVVPLWQQPDPGQTDLALYLNECRLPTRVSLRPWLDKLLGSPAWQYAGDMQEADFQALCLLLERLIRHGYWSLG
ncbi:cupin domain-containing protein [Bowmanella dokdonensis]|uniref:Cupin domain-containing protein n=1 Tax=Bowmanella dokdonensis TaxID=751969 RepID=A0A939DJR8_9ALTE|nr:cupin domain-containing protein [Bowmanella dokdonensis]MBN7823927.1 cupin domain-containing protein [Bowmanella dokdonensis]